ncbi:MAG: class I SAM-dependent RNA methyltransferase [Clostridia bacterium]|nr:class I SAM-dependent RNA methyltransferase [Clostridia bacterium]MBT7121998.1 class I SAM-dependent RNA methyltransferase [Clostridia bacterium]
MTYNCFASCSFGLEGMSALELRKLSFTDVQPKDARVYFKADLLGIAKANMWLRTADRVYIEIAHFSAVTFDELFENVKQIAWEEYLPQNAAFPVDGDSVKSTLFSVSDVQSISKKAIVDRLMAKHNTKTLPESGNRYNVHIKILRDEVSVCLNTSGAGLNRRGYRVTNVSAPIRETLAAGLVMLSGWRTGAFADPMCGSGTIAIEAAMIGANIAPGRSRTFDSEYWHFIDDEFSKVRAQAKLDITDAKEVYASDIDKKAVRATDANAQAAGVDLRIYHADVSDFARKGCSVLTNPPYAARLGEQQQVRKLYRQMGDALRSTQRKYIITADNEFERYFGKRADKKRKLYNGNIRCTFYQYFKPVK